MYSLFRTLQPYRNTLVICILFSVTLGLYSFRWFHGLYGGDFVTAAERVLSGQVPYRDFWTMYAPGSFYLLAWLYRIFGTHILVGTVAASVLCAGAACVCYRLAVNLTGKDLPGLICAGIFFAASFSTVYCITPGPYPATILLVLTALNLFVHYNRTGSTAALLAAGIATGAAIVFKHDVGGYTGLAIAAGLVTGQLLPAKAPGSGMRGLVGKLGVYAAGAALPALPVAVYFALLAGPEMWQDLVVFPATEFRHARPENYPGLWPDGIHHEWRLKMLFNLFVYLEFTIPFALFLATMAALVVAAFRRRYDYLVPGITLGVAYLLHYSSAHIQVNTNIISMSLYAALLGTLLYMLIGGAAATRRPAWPDIPAAVFAAGWMLALVTQPVYNQLRLQEQATAKLELPRVSGIRVTLEEQQVLEELYELTETRLRQDEKLFIGLHRHDASVIGDSLTYFVLDRLNATRHDQLHPGVIDRPATQRRIISDLEAGNIDLILTKHIFSDKIIERAKQRLTAHLDDSGATLLDAYIRENFAQTRTIGQYTVWERKRGRRQPDATRTSSSV